MKKRNTEVIASLISLTQLTINNLEITRFPEKWAVLMNLKSLDLKNNKITDLKTIASLTNLEELNLSKNNIRDITPVYSLTNLTKLDLNGNTIETIPLGIEGLTKLTYLNLQNVGLKSFPEAITPLLKNLTYLNISRNGYKLEALGEGIPQEAWQIREFIDRQVFLNQ